jgi:hypothetical protein
MGRQKDKEIEIQREGGTEKGEIGGKTMKQRGGKWGDRKIKR